MMRIITIVAQICDFVNTCMAWEGMCYNLVKVVMANEVVIEQRSRGREIFNHIVLYFAIGCVFGTYWEEILYMVRSVIETGALTWVSRRGLLYGPFSPVYGMGAVLIYLIFGTAFRKKVPSIPACFIGGALVGGALEYVLSWVQEMLFGTISWDYSTYFLNINGRTTIPYMIIWGALIVVFARFVFPLVEKAYAEVAVRKMNIVCAVLAGILTVDIGISMAAAVRQAMRRAGDTADNALEVILDKYYNDERLEKTYSNAREVKK